MKGGGLPLMALVLKSHMHMALYEAAVVTSQLWSSGSRGEQWRLQGVTGFGGDERGMQEQEEAGGLCLTCWSVELRPLQMGKGVLMTSLLTVGQAAFFRLSLPKCCTVIPLIAINFHLKNLKLHS